MHTKEKVSIVGISTLKLKSFFGKCNSVAKLSLKTAKELSAFLDDLLTEEEILDLSQRLKIAKLITGDWRAHNTPFFFQEFSAK